MIRSILLFFFAILTPFSVYAGENDSVSIRKGQETLIYYSSGAEIVGTPNIYNAKVVKIENAAVSENLVKHKKKYLTIQEQVTSKKTAQNQSLKRLQEKINQKVKNYYSASQENELVRLEKFRLNSSATFNNFSSFNFSYAFVSDEYLLNIFGGQLAKQKFYTSISYLQFSKLRDSFLRGPPANSFS